MAYEYAITTPIIHQEYKRDKNCPKWNNNTTEQLVIIICISKVNINTVDKYMQQNKT